MAKTAAGSTRTLASEWLLAAAVVLDWLSSLLGFIRVPDGSDIGIGIPNAIFGLVVVPLTVWYFVFRRGQRWPGIYLVVVGVLGAVSQIGTDDALRYGVSVLVASAGCALAWLRRPAR